MLNTRLKLTLCKSRRTVCVTPAFLDIIMYCSSTSAYTIEMTSPNRLTRFALVSRYDFRLGFSNFFSVKCLFFVVNDDCVELPRVVVRLLFKYALSIGAYTLVVTNESSSPLVFSRRRFKFSRMLFNASETTGTLSTNAFTSTTGTLSSFSFSFRRR